MAKCPHCDGSIDKDNIKVEEIVRIKPFKMRNNMFICPICDKILGFGSNF